jgi:hypothetical protein
MDRLALYIGGLSLIIALALIRACSDVRAIEEAAAPGEVQPLGEPETVRIFTDEFHRGVCIGIFPYDDERPRYRRDMAEIRELGANAVSLNFNWFMETIDSPTVYAGVADRNNQTPDDTVLAQAINDAHAAGLKVMLFPTIYIMRLAPTEWRGRIQPADWDVWFNSYRALVLDLARLSERFGAEYLCIGVELLSTEHFNDRWRRLIADVRDVFAGKLLYSCNWDAQRKHDWFHDLDIIATNAYWKLVDHNDPTEEELLARWDTIRAEMRAWRRWLKLPLVVSEIGYRSTDGTTIAPWNYFAEGRVDLDEQRLAYDAFFKAWFDDDMFQGVYFYQWFGRGGPEDVTYTPRGKPAAEVLSGWFGRIQAREPWEHGFAAFRESQQTARQAVPPLPERESAAPGGGGGLNWPLLPGVDEPPRIESSETWPTAPKPAELRVTVDGPQVRPVGSAQWYGVGELMPGRGDDMWLIRRIDAAAGTVVFADAATGETTTRRVPSASDPGED